MVVLTGKLPDALSPFSYLTHAQWEKHPPIYDPPDLTHRTIKIDSLDISQLQRTSIRQQITSIPQDALYVPGTLRFNTDPFGLSTDSKSSQRSRK